MRIDNPNFRGTHTINNPKIYLLELFNLVKLKKIKLSCPLDGSNLELLVSKNRKPMSYLKQLPTFGPSRTLPLTENPATWNRVWNNKDIQR
jgi:hypothetical protein